MKSTIIGFSQSFSSRNAGFSARQCQCHRLQNMLNVPWGTMSKGEKEAAIRLRPKSCAHASPTCVDVVRHRPVFSLIVDVD